MARHFDDFFRDSYDQTVRGLELDGTRTDDAHDAAQEAYVRAYARWWRVGHYREPAAWVRRVAVNVVRDQHRQRTTRENALPKLVSEPMTVPAVADIASVDGLDDALDLLPPQQRRAVDLYYGDGFSTEEAANRMGISPGAFRFHLSRARRSLKPRMAEKLGRQEPAVSGRKEAAR
ncbi:MAG: sigma-70 family RNA polymerase sigma factor [Acidimicrobiales bacterium]|nr:sigma-70 family RNA polymerase sigma factor [Acidimicrobiales bacterium]